MDFCSYKVYLILFITAEGFFILCIGSIRNVYVNTNFGFVKFAGLQYL